MSSPWRTKPGIRCIPSTARRITHSTTRAIRSSWPRLPRPQRNPPHLGTVGRDAGGRIRRIDSVSRIGFADTISGTLVRQTMFAEFEHRAHIAIAERGEPLTPESLSAIYGETARCSTVPGVLNDERTRARLEPGASLLPRLLRLPIRHRYFGRIGDRQQIRDEGRKPAMNGISACSRQAAPTTRSRCSNVAAPT